MKSKHDNLNTDFCDELDFSEVKVYEGKTDKLDNHKTKDSVPVSSLGNTVITLVRNSAISIVAAMLITPVPLFMWAVPGPGEGITSLFPVAAMVAVPVILYVMVGFLLKQLPKYNFLSVLALCIFMMVFGTPFVLGSYFFENALGSFFNMPALIIVSMLLELSLDVERLDPQLYLASLIAAFVPSMFMYSGLRLKIWKHKRSESNVEQA